MATKEVKDLIDGAPTALGGDGSLNIESQLMFQNPDGTTRKVSVKHLLGFLGINVGTESEITAVIASRSEPMTGFVTNALKSNHVEGSGTFAETAGTGTGLLAQWQSSSDAEGVDDGSDVTT